MSTRERLAEYRLRERLRALLARSERLDTPKALKLIKAYHSALKALQ